MIYMTPKAEHWQIAKEACGVMKAQQRAEEFAMMLTMLSEMDPKPKTMLEIGCAEGGSLFGWAQVVPEIYGITLWSKENEVRDWHGARVFLSDSRKPEALEWITKNLDGRELDVLFIDDEHTYDLVKYNFETYSPLVRQGGFVLVHDVAAHRRFFPGLKQWWEELNRGYILTDTLAPELKIGFGIIEIGKD